MRIVGACELLPWKVCKFDYGGTDKGYVTWRYYCAVGAVVISEAALDAAIESPAVGSVTTLAPVSLSTRWNYVGAQVFLQPARQRTTRRASCGAATALRSC